MSHKSPESLRFDDLAILSKIAFCLSQRDKSQDELLLEVAACLETELRCFRALTYLLDSTTYQLRATLPPGDFPLLVRCPERRKELKQARALGFNPIFTPEIRPLPPQPPDRLEGFLANAFDCKTPVVLFPELRQGALPELKGGSLLITTIRTSANAWGLLCLFRASGQPVFTVVEQEFVDLVAAQLGLIVENNELNIRYRKKIDELEAFSRFSSEVNRRRSIKGLVESGQAFIQDFLGFDASMIYLNYEEESRQFWSRGTTPLQKKILREHLESVSQRLGQKLSMDEEGLAELVFESEAKIPAFLTVPLFIGGVSIRGFIVLSRVEQAFSRNDLRLLLTCSNILSQAFQTSITTGKMEKKIEEQSVLFEITQTMTSTLKIDEVLQFISNIAGEMGNCDSAELFLFEDGFFYPRYTYGRKDLIPFEEGPLAIDEPLVKTLFARKKPHYEEQVHQNRTYFSGDRLFKEQVKSFITVPIFQRNTPLGILFLLYRKARKFSPGYLRFFQTVASQAAIALENACMFETTRANFFQTIKTLGAAIEAKDPYTRGHCDRVLEFSEKIGREIGLDQEEIENLRFGALLHDIGKIGIDDSILKKPSGLTEEEFSKMKYHPLFGGAIMKNASFLSRVAPIAYHHHERFDGKGYPDGLAGVNIPLGARIVTIADSYDCMTTDRPYRKALPPPLAVKELLRCKSRQFDPDLVDRFVAILQRDYFVHVPDSPHSVDSGQI